MICHGRLRAEVIAILSIEPRFRQLCVPLMLYNRNARFCELCTSQTASLNEFRIGVTVELSLDVRRGVAAKRDRNVVASPYLIVKSKEAVRSQTSQYSLLFKKGTERRIAWREPERCRLSLVRLDTQFGTDLKILLVLSVLRSIREL